MVSSTDIPIMCSLDLISKNKLLEIYICVWFMLTSYIHSINLERNTTTAHVDETGLDKVTRNLGDMRLTTQYLTLPIKLIYSFGGR